MDAPALCGGTFFTLILEAAKQGLNQRNKGWGEKSQFTESAVLESLIRVAVPTFPKPSDGDNFKTAVSAYKSCGSRSGRLAINGQANLSTFDTTVKSNYREPLAAMTEVVNHYLNAAGNGDWLTRALLELVDEDPSIADDDEFYVLPDGGPITKAGLRSLTDICLPSLLLGIWHYAVTKKPDNRIGKTTYDQWCKPGATGSVRQFESNIGAKITRPLNISMTAQESTNEPEPQIDIIEAEIVEDDEDDAKPSTDGRAQTGSKPANGFQAPVFNYFGDNGTQIQSVGVLNISHGGR